MLADFEPAAAAAAARAFSSLSFSSLLCAESEWAKKAPPEDSDRSDYLKFGGGAENAVANSIENVGGRGRRREELGQEVVAPCLQDDLIVDVSDVHHLRNM